MSFKKQNANKVHGYFPNKIAAVTVMIFKSVYSDQQIVEKCQKYLLPSHMLESQFSTSDF